MFAASITGITLPASSNVERCSALNPVVPQISAFLCLTAASSVTIACSTVAKSMITSHLSISSSTSETTGTPSDLPIIATSPRSVPM